MACYVLRSCTPGDTTIISTNTDLSLYIGTTINIDGETACFTVELAADACAECASPVSVIVSDPPDCECTSLFPCYILVECTGTIPPFNVSTNLNPYLGLDIQCSEYPGYCFTVVGETNIENCIDAPAITCIDACSCPPEPICMRLLNCQIDGLNIGVTYSTSIPVGTVISINPVPAPYIGYPNCWTVQDPSPSPCDGSEYLITSYVDETDCETCLSPVICYSLTPCASSASPVLYTTTNLSLFTGNWVTSADLGECYLVAISALCVSPEPINATILETCECPPAGYCYLLTNCDSPSTTIYVNYASPLVVGSVIKPTPEPPHPGGTDNCWTVTGLVPCETFFTPITSVINYLTCTACKAPPACYSLTTCDGETTIYTNSNMLAFVGQYVSSPLLGNVCYYVNISVTCTSPIIVNPASFVSCNCPCYTLTDCEGAYLPFTTFADLSAYVGQVVRLDEYGGCAASPCFEVTLNTSGACTNNPATVSTGCTPCPECKPTLCYPLIDCITKAPYITLTSPTSNGVNLSAIVGDVISKICIDAAQTTCVYGCWEIGPATETCNTAVLRYVYNIYDNCITCTNKCYEFVSCTTQLVAYTILDEPNTHGLPPLASLVGQTITDLCFDRSCPPGCFYVRKKENGDCTSSTGYDLITALTVSPTFCCQDECYLVSPCDGSLEPFIVSNDLSAYIGEVINACFTVADEQVCKCLQVIRANSCQGSIVLDTIIDSFETCEDCKYCGCPAGYEKVDDQCQKIVTVPAVLSPIVFTVTGGSKNQLYGTFGTRFYANISALPGPFTQSGTNFLDAGSVPLTFTTNITGVWGPGLLTSRLNTVGVWTGAAPNPVDEWIGFTHCVTLAQTGTYCVAVAGDNGVRFSLDGILLVNAPNNIQFNFEYWHVFELTLTAGTHVIAVEGYNYGGPAAFGAEIYNATAAFLQTLTTPAQLQNPAITVFSTFDKIDETFDIGEDSGYTCPDGYTFSLCDGSPECTGIQTTPFIVCPPTYKVTLCTGQGVSYDPIITNTDLSAYIGTFNVCVDNPTFSTSYFVLKDCNGIVPDICTTTILTNSLWESIVLIDYPGSCFIVTGVIEGQTCSGAVAVATLEEPCVCTGAGTPWPDGCYCVTVEEIPSQIGIDFYGTFGQEYQCCDDCLRTCYLLTSCVPGIAPIIVCNDLATYADQNKVIKITGCGDICWNVAIASTCSTSIYLEGIITEFDDCTECLPQVPPAPPLVLHPRKIKPGYNSPNCSISVDYIQRVNCNFAEQVYNQMLVNRYGITVCCNEDLTKWDIKKQVLDYELLIDPSLCKSTICYCPDPCFVSVIITVLPTCVAPYLVEAILDPLCIAPVLESVEIIVDSSLPCYCYTTEILEVGPTPIILGYVDCCCKDVIQVIDVVTTINMCALYPPVTSEPSSTNVTSSGLCSDLCVVPPPVCICWQIINIGYSENLSANITYTPCGSETPVVLRMAAAVISVCSYNMPTGVTTGDLITVNNLGPCSDRCNEGCKCFLIEFDEPDADFEIFNCETKNIQTTNAASGAYLCSGTVPIAIGPLTNFSITLVDPADFTCSIGPLGLRCNPVPVAPCICYGVAVPFDGSEHFITITDCAGSIQTPGYFGGTYYICSQNGISTDPSVTYSPTMFGCGPGQCVEP
jgi:hypothetical protein